MNPSRNPCLLASPRTLSPRFFRPPACHAPNAIPPGVGPRIIAATLVSAAGSLMACFTVAASLLAGVATQAAEFPYALVPVGDAGNTTGGPAWQNNRTVLTPWILGMVDYSYWMGKYEVTNAQYCEFLNAKAVTDSYGLYHTDMGDKASGGITRTGSSGSYVYTLKANMADKPVNNVCRYDALRFANWLNNGRGNGSTETGPYTITGGGVNAGTVTMPNHADLANGPLTYVLPNQNEWFKAAYYKGGTTTAGYWKYATQSDTKPMEAHLDALGNIDGYFNSGTSGAYTTPVGTTAVLNNFQNRVHTVGSGGPASQSYYGTFNQDDNVTELVENTYNQNGIRETVLGSSSFYGLDVHGLWFGDLWLSSEQEDFGFRIAAVGIVPEVPFDGRLTIVRNAPYLHFTWNSRSGKLYRLWSSPNLASRPPTGWTLVQESIPAYPPSLQILQPADPKMFYVLEEYPAPPVLAFSENFDGDVTGWTTGGSPGGSPTDPLQTEWQLGPPTNVGPPAAFSPLNCYGTNISGPYGNSANVWLRSPPINLTAYTSGTLNFEEFKDIEKSYDFGSILVLSAADGGLLASLEAKVDGTSDTWQSYSKPLPTAAFAQPIQIEFRLQSDDWNSVPYAGWYIDDFQISVNAAVSSFATWASGFTNPPLSNPAANADPDNDGLGNAVEYVLGTDPRYPSKSGISTSVDGSNLILTFKRADSSETPEVGLRVEVSTDLTHWTTIPGYVIGAGNAAPTSLGVDINEAGPDNTDIITVTIPMVPNANKFARLAVTVP